MSYVTNILLAYSTADDQRPDLREHPIFERINAYLATVSQCGFVRPMDDAWYGGTKCLTGSLLIGAFHTVSVESLVTFLQTLPWKYPSAVQLMVKGEDQVRYRLITVCAWAKAGCDEPERCLCTCCRR